MVALTLFGAALAAGAKLEAVALAEDGVAWPALTVAGRWGEESELGAHLTVATIAGYPAFAVGPAWMKPWSMDRLTLGAAYSRLDGLQGLSADLRWDHDAAEKVSFSSTVGWRHGTFVPHTAGASFVISAYPRPWLRFSSGPQLSYSAEGPDFHLVFGAELLPIPASGLSLFVDLGIPSLYTAGLRWTPGGRTLRDRDRAGWGPDRAGVL